MYSTKLYFGDYCKASFIGHKMPSGTKIEGTSLIFWLPNVPGAHQCGWALDSLRPKVTQKVCEEPSDPLPLRGPPDAFRPLNL